MISPGHEHLIVSRQETVRFIRSIYLHRACIAVTLMLWGFSVVMEPGSRIEAMSLPARALYNGVGALAFYVIGYGLLPGLVWRALVRNIPLAWVAIGFYSLLAALETLIQRSVFAPDSVWLNSLWYWLTTVVMIVVAVAIVTHYFEDVLRRNLSRLPQYLPVWRPAGTPDSQIEALLPAEMRAPVRRIEAQNQYVRVVTRRGETLLRMSLTEAEKLLTPDTGLRIHRSIWISRAEIGELVFRDGNPRLRDGQGAEFPVSRKKVDALRAILKGMA